MTFAELLKIVGDEPVFETGLLLAGAVDPVDTRRQLSRWTSAGRLYRLRRGLYALAPPYQKARPHPFVVANRMVRASYVSLHSALAFHGLIPERVPVTTSITTTRPGRWNTPLGEFEFRHVKNSLFQGYLQVEVSGRQRAFIASPEKALLDLVYLAPEADSLAYLAELRLQHLDAVDIDALQEQARNAGSPKLQRAAAMIAVLRRAEAREYEAL